MAKNRRRNPPTAEKSVLPPLFSRRGKKLMAAGAATVVVGFIILTFTDPSGQNWASHLSPVLLVLGYSCFGAGIVWRDSPKTTF